MRKESNSIVWWRNVVDRGHERHWQVMRIDSIGKSGRPRRLSARSIDASTMLVLALYRFSDRVVVFF